jgi:hypothetical protein
MTFFFLIAGIVIALFGIIKYITLSQREAKDYTLLGFKVSEELLWILTFVTGFIFMLVFVIEKLGPHFANKGM